MMKKINKDDMKSQMMKVKGGEFLNWYNNLTNKQREVYRTELLKLKDKVR